MTSNSGNNHGGFASAEYDKLVSEANHSDAPETRYALYRKAEALLIEEMPILPIFFGRRNYLLNPKVTGWRSNPMFLHLLQHLSL